jgi:tRNA acetyltransferase TAN1
MRNHNTMKRDAIIKMVAGLVGQPHKVDLKNYDLLITIEIYQVCLFLSMLVNNTDRERVC